MGVSHGIGTAEDAVEACGGELSLHHGVIDPELT